jgi:hypothetical protein
MEGFETPLVHQSEKPNKVHNERFSGRKKLDQFRGEPKNGPTNRPVEHVLGLPLKIRLGDLLRPERCEFALLLFRGMLHLVNQHIGNYQVDQYGALAHLVERIVRNDEVIGSSPVGSTKFGLRKRY